MKKFKKPHLEWSNKMDQPLVHIYVDYSHCKNKQDASSIEAWEKEGVFSRLKVDEILNILNRQEFTFYSEAS